MLTHACADPDPCVNSDSCVVGIKYLIKSLWKGPGKHFGAPLLYDLLVTGGHHKIASW